jgi:nicotinamidase-related amidase
MPAPEQSPDLHGSAPDQCPVALLLIDVINDLEFDGGDRVLEQALPMARAIAALKRRAREAGVPVVYANDNFGRWRSDFSKTVEHVLKGGVRGQRVAELLHPDGDDYFVLKPKNSGFFSTTLHTLLQHLGARALIMGGIATDNCVLFTASDAHMRDYRVLVPEDCVAAKSAERTEHALRLMRDACGADTTPSTELDLGALAREP